MDSGHRVGQAHAHEVPCGSGTRRGGHPADRPVIDRRVRVIARSRAVPGAVDRRVVNRIGRAAKPLGPTRLLVEAVAAGLDADASRR